MFINLVVRQQMHQVSRILSFQQPFTRITVVMSKRKSTRAVKTDQKSDGADVDTKHIRKHVKVEYEEKVNNETEMESKEWRPQHFDEQWTNIKTMRRFRDAPVDIIGCDKLGDPSEQPKVLRYQHLLALMLSSQTKDEVTSAAMFRLRKHGCNVDNILATSTEELQKLIYPVGFYKRKTDFIKRTSQILKDDFECDIPETPGEMCKLPGVGPKMAHILMKVAWNVISGIGVDVHVHRIVNRLKWVKSVTKTPEETRIALQEWLPREYWQDVNVLLVGFGQQTCQPVRPMCSVCLNSDICPSAHKVLTTKVEKGKIKK